MKAYEITLKSTTPIIFSRKLEEIEHPKLEREQADAYDLRVWPQKAHINPDGEAVIPAVYFKRALEESAKFLGLPIKGKGKATYTKHFLSGVQVLHDLPLGVKREDLTPVPISCNVDGKRGSGSRVTRRFPVVQKWAGQITVLVVDELITEDVLKEHLVKAGLLIGIGSFRIAKGNSSGGFTLEKIAPAQL
jgi:hypothetical protein